jgi:hypothetical protein
LPSSRRLSNDKLQASAGCRPMEKRHFFAASASM